MRHALSDSLPHRDSSALSWNTHRAGGSSQQDDPCKLSGSSTSIDIRPSVVTVTVFPSLPCPSQPLSSSPRLPQPRPPFDRVLSTPHVATLIAEQALPSSRPARGSDRVAVKRWLSGPPRGCTCLPWSLRATAAQAPDQEGGVDRVGPIGSVSRTQGELGFWARSWLRGGQEVW